MFYQSLGMLRIQRKILKKRFEQPLQQLAQKSLPVWSSTDALEQLLRNQFDTIPKVYSLYAINRKAQQISASISESYLDLRARGRDLSQSDYAESLYPKRYFTLSPVYINTDSGEKYTTALQPVLDHEEFLGFIAADFKAGDLLMPIVPSSTARQFASSVCVTA